MNNYEKNEKYKILMSKMKKAMLNEFYYEAILLEFAIIEDRTEALLKHADLKIKTYDNKTLTLNDKLKKISHSPKFKEPYILKHLNQELISSIHEWKNERNKIIHDLVGITYSNEEIERIAKVGYELVKKLNNKSSLVNQYLERKKQELVSV